METNRLNQTWNRTSPVGVSSRASSWPALDDKFEFSIPMEQVYSRAQVDIIQATRAGASLRDQPAVGDTGALAVTVHWWLDAGGSLEYRIQVFSDDDTRWIRFVRFRSQTGSYIHEVGTVVNCAGNAHEQASRFLLVDRAGTRLAGGAAIHLVSARGFYVCAEDGGLGGPGRGSEQVTTTRVLPRSWETFELVDAATPASTSTLGHGSQVALRTDAGTFLTAHDAPGSLLASAIAIGANQTFTLELVGGDVGIPSTGLDPPHPLGHFVDATRMHVRTHEIPAAAIAIFHDSRPEVVRGFGFLDRTRRLPVLPSTLFVLASVDKPVTRMATELWMKRASVRRRTRYFPYLRSLGLVPEGDRMDDARIEDITFQQLMDGYSGLRQDIPDNLATIESRASWAWAHGLLHAPGTRYEYPNFEHDLLRFAMQTQLGGRASFASFLQDELLGPLGSRDIDLLWDGAANPREPFYVDDGFRRPNRHLLITASADAIGRLFSRYQGDGRPVQRDNPTLAAIEIRRARVLPGVQVRGGIRINCGGPRVMVDGVAWSADDGPIDGSSIETTTNAIANTPHDTLYQTQRAGRLHYHFPVSRDRYRVTLHFAEITAKNPGDRRFNVLANDAPAIEELDIAAAAGAGDTALERTFFVDVEDSEGITIDAAPHGGVSVHAGGLPGIIVLVRQNFGARTVTVSMCNSSASNDEILQLLSATDLIGHAWP